MILSPRLTTLMLACVTLLATSLTPDLAYASPPTDGLSLSTQASDGPRLSLVTEGLVQTGASTVGAAGMGALFGLAGAIGGFLVSDDSIFSREKKCGASCAAGFTGLTVGASLGGALSTQLVGRLNHSSGKFAPTLLGSTLGAGIGLGLGRILESPTTKGNLDRKVIFVCASLGASLGSVLGYQLSSRQESSGDDASHALEASQVQLHLNF